MLCLGIETSCDETAVALVEEGRLVRSLTASQANLHAIFGGVVPELASREHYKIIGPLFDRLMADSGRSPADLDAVAVARGPGLLGSLLVGVAFAKGLALTLDKPLIGVNHLRAHLLACGLDAALSYPALGVLASGGHTCLYKINSFDSFEPLGATLDDAAGEAFDKIGCALGLPYPAGARVDALAREGEPDFSLPLPLSRGDSLDFSFSGLKTAAVKSVSRSRPKGRALNDFCAGLNQAVAETLAIKAGKALERPDCKGVSAVWLAGGVAANSRVRQRLAELAASRGLPLLMPQLKFCSDNAAMIAYNGWLLAAHGKVSDLRLEAVPRGRKMPDDYRKAPSLDSRAFGQ